MGTFFIAGTEWRALRREGVLYSFFVGTALGVAFVLAPLSKAYISPFLYLWGMYLVTAVMLVCTMKGQKVELIKGSFKTYASAVLSIGIGSFLSYLIVVILAGTIPVGVIVSVRELSIVFGCLLGFVFLKEKLTLSKIIGILGVVLGTILLKWG